MGFVIYYILRNLPNNETFLFPFLIDHIPLIISGQKRELIGKY